LVILVTTVVFIIARISLPTRLPPLGYVVFLVDVVPFAIIAVGIARMSRVAAVTGLVLYLGPKVLQVVHGAVGPIGVGISFTLTLLFINGIRGTFAYHRLSADGTR
jgi:hypothetical protein